MKHITHVAIKLNGIIHSLPKPNRHHHIIRQIYEETGKPVRGKDIQGFLDNEGNFLSRIEAMKVAVEANQILENSLVLSELYSENLW